MTKPLNIKQVKKRATEVSGLLRHLSHPNRLLIACDLTAGEKGVSAIEADTGVPQPHLSRELARLREAGLIIDRRESRNVYYRIADRRLTVLITALCDAFGGKGAKR
ncbi:MAG: metalloregulator ArsR/SmtB family transcription factor [Hyphococcus sp.]